MARCRYRGESHGEEAGDDGRNDSWGGALGYAKNLLWTGKMKKLVVVANSVQAAEETYGKARPSDVTADYTNSRWLHDNGDETWFVPADHIDFPRALERCSFDELDLRCAIPPEHDEWLRAHVIRPPA